MIIAGLVKYISNIKVPTDEVDDLKSFMTARPLEGGNHFLLFVLWFPDVGQDMMCTLAHTLNNYIS